MKCPYCGCNEAVYQSMSGGELGYCPDEDEVFELSLLPPDEQPRAVNLQSNTGRIALQAAMDQELAKRRDERK